MLLAIVVLPAAPATAGTPDPAAAPASASAAAPAPAPHRPPRYQGAFFAAQAHAGLAMRLKPGDGEWPGPVVGLSGRVASVVSLADVLLGIYGTRLRPTSSRQGTAPGPRPTLLRLTLTAEARLHPLFTQILQGTPLDLWLSGLYLSLGLDLDVSWLTASERSAHGVAVGGHVGVGMSWPLTNPDDGASLWLGLGYQVALKHTPSALRRLAPLGDLDEHALILTLGWRDNRISSFYVPRPTELDDRDPRPAR